jgi:hypothetical protein
VASSTTAGPADPVLFGQGQAASTPPSVAPASGPFAATGVPAWDAAVGGTEPSAGPDRYATQDVYDEDDDEPRHAYTWLHYLILVAVAFVLGLLIWELVLGPHGSAAGAQGSGVGVTQLADAHTTTITTTDQGVL